MPLLGADGMQRHANYLSVSPDMSVSYTLVRPEPAPMSVVLLVILTAAAFSLKTHQFNFEPNATFHCTLAYPERGDIIAKEPLQPLRTHLTLP